MDVKPFAIQVSESTLADLQQRLALTRWPDEISGSAWSYRCLYYESRQRPLHFNEGESVEAPCAVARFLKEAPFPPREWVERAYNVQRWTEFATGGHFAAMEEPDLLVEDIRSFFRPLRNSI